VVITVADNGAGMSPDDIRLAFEPFGRAHGELTARTPGTGLGLPIARALMRLHGGDLTLTSKPGAGTTATAVFPAETRAPAAVPAAAAA
jgi:signal transduction histidine kinase